MRTVLVADAVLESASSGAMVDVQPATTQGR
jgi:hypothetical protein